MMTWNSQLAPFKRAMPPPRITLWRSSGSATDLTVRCRADGRTPCRLAAKPLETPLQSATIVALSVLMMGVFER